MNQTQKIGEMMDLVSKQGLQRAGNLLIDAARGIPAGATPKSGARLGLSDRECQRWTFTGAIVARVSGRATFEIECDRALRRQGCETERELDILIPREVLEYRAMDAVPGSKGGYAIAGPSESYTTPCAIALWRFAWGCSWSPDKLATWPGPDAPARPHRSG